jgi:hypothetical protein
MRRTDLLKNMHRKKRSNLVKQTIFRDGLEEKADGPLIVSSTREGHCVESYQVSGTERFFVTLAGTHYCAHGHTLAEAIADAVWKDEKRKPSLEAVKEEIRKEGKARKITLQEFRLLTGACLTGCQIALKQAGLDGSPMPASEIKKHFPEWGVKLLAILEWK